MKIRRIEEFTEGEFQALCDILCDCVVAGASVSFVLPMTLAKAQQFWTGAFSHAQNGGRLILVAEIDGLGLVGTVQVILQQPENQLHRADISKMLVHSRARRKGVGAALLQAAETAAQAAQKTTLVLDTANPDAERVYRANGWCKAGTIPNYAVLPDGQLCATVYYYKQL